MVPVHRPADQRMDDLLKVPLAADVKTVEEHVPVLPALCSTSVHQIRLLDGSNLELSVLQFDESLFNLEHFQRASIACPDSVARSIRKRQAEFFFGRLAARLALQRIDVVSANVAIGPSREPQWPRGIVGSISHTRRLAVAAVSDESRMSGLGIDVESIVLEQFRAALVKLTLSQDELRLIQDSPGSWSLDERITLVFSAKESVFKGAFNSVQRFFDFDAARVSMLNLNTGRLVISLAEHLNDEYFFGRRCELSFSRLEKDTVLVVFPCLRGGCQLLP